MINNCHFTSSWILWSSVLLPLLGPLSGIMASSLDSSRTTRF